MTSDDRAALSLGGGDPSPSAKPPLLPASRAPSPPPRLTPGSLIPAPSLRTTFPSLPRGQLAT